MNLRKVCTKVPAILLLIFAGIFAVFWLTIGDPENAFSPERRKFFREANRRLQLKLETRKRQKYPDIVFIRTSEQPLEWFELCALYTAGRKNPYSMVKLLGAKTFSFPQFLSSLPNVFQETLNFSQIFKKTPLMQWFKTGRWRVKDFVKRVRFLSDAVRLAYLYKHGGIYMDTDSITLRSLEKLKNGLAYQGNISSGMWLANGFLVFKKTHHPFLKLAMNLHEKTFDPDKREFKFGPALVTKTFRKYSNKLSMMNSGLPGTQKQVLPPVKAYPQELVYPVAVSEFKNLFRPKGKRLDLEKKISSAYTLHLWRNQVRKVMGNPHLKPDRQSLLYLIAAKECPAALSYSKSVKH